MFNDLILNLIHGENGIKDTWVEDQHLRNDINC